MLLYAISDRRLLGRCEPERLAGLVEMARKWARGGVDCIQIREKDLGGEELLELARGVVGVVREEQSAQAFQTRVLLNGQAEIALAAGADGVHLPGDAAVEAARMAEEMFARAGRPGVVSRACHSADEAARFRAASLLVYAPVFEKSVAGSLAVAGAGLSALADVCRAAGAVPVLALGGVTAANAQACVAAGAAGVAAIRLFLSDGWLGLRGL